MRRAVAAPPVAPVTYGYAFWPDAETWYGGKSPSRAAAVEAARAQHPAAPTVYTARARYLANADVLEVLPKAEDLVEQINDGLGIDSPWGFYEECSLSVTASSLASLEACLRSAWELWLTVHPEALAPIWVAEEIEAHVVDVGDAA